VNLVILEPGEVSHSGEVTLCDGRAEHLLRVLRVAPAQEVRVGLLDGPRGVGTVQFLAERAVGLRCAFEPHVPPRPGVDLLLAMPRPKVLRRLWAQLAALGVGRIILTNAERVERDYFDTHTLSPGCYRPLLIEGLQQAQDTRLPEVSIHRRFRVLVEDELDALCPAGLRLVADPSASEPPGEIAALAPAQRILLAVGPEGGWNAFELQLLGSHGFHAVGMGRRTLRTDTACIALLSRIIGMNGGHGTERDGSQ
jgi:16S rRNA (uracil1498-N3)-methyltransferase